MLHARKIEPCHMRKTWIHARYPLHRWISHKHDIDACHKLHTQIHYGLHECYIYTCTYMWTICIEVKEIHANFEWIGQYHKVQTYPPCHQWFMEERASIGWLQFHGDQASENIDVHLFHSLWEAFELASTKPMGEQRKKNRKKTSTEDGSFGSENKEIQRAGRLKSGENKTGNVPRNASVLDLCWGPWQGAVVPWQRGGVGSEQKRKRKGERF